MHKIFQMPILYCILGILFVSISIVSLFSLAYIPHCSFCPFIYLLTASVNEIHQIIPGLIPTILTVHC